MLKNVTVQAVSWGVGEKKSEKESEKSGENCMKRYNGNRRPSLESLSP